MLRKVLSNIEQRKEGTTASTTPPLQATKDCHKWSHLKVWTTITTITSICTVLRSTYFFPHPGIHINSDILSLSIYIWQCFWHSIKWFFLSVHFQTWAKEEKEKGNKETLNILISSLIRKSIKISRGMC